MSSSRSRVRPVRTGQRPALPGHRRALLALAAVGCLVVTSACGGSRLDHGTLEAAFRSGATANPAASGQQTDSLAPGAPAGPGEPAAAPGGATPGGGASTQSAGTAPGAGPAASGPTKGSAAGKPVAAGRTCTGTEKPIVLATVGEQSGVAGASLANGPQTVSAWAGWINRNGGLACHQVKYLIGDAKGDPAKNASLTQQFIEKDGAVAFVQWNAALSGSGGRDYLIKSGVPVIGGDGADQAFYEHPTWFPQAPQGDVAVLAALGALAKSLNADQRAHFGIVACQEAAQCTNGAKLAEKYAPQVGLKIVYNGSASLLQADYTSVCLNAQKAGVQALIIAFDGNGMSRFAKSCRSVNYVPVFGTAESAITGSMAKDPNLDGMVIGSLAAPWTNNANKSIAQMNAVLAQYAPGVSNAGQAHLGWTSAKLLEAASAFFPAKDAITSADIVAALDKVKNNDLGGLTGPLTFSAGRNAPPLACFFTMAISKSQWIATNGARRFCA